MKTLLCILVLSFTLTSRAAEDWVLYGAWWDVVAKGAPKQAGEFVITLENFGNVAAVGVLTIRVKQSSGKNTGTTDNYVYHGMWEGQKNPNPVKVHVDKVLTYDTAWLGTLNIA